MPIFPWGSLAASQRSTAKAIDPEYKPYVDWSNGHASDWSNKRSNTK
jgi:hypothetical protein